MVTLNGAYQPISGQSPAGYAKYMAFYTKAYVVGATMVVKGVVINNSTNAGCNVGVTVSTNNTSFASSIAAIENGMCQWDVIFNLPDRFSFRESVDVKKFLNKPNVLDDPQLYSAAAANPAQVIDAHVWSEAQATTGAAITVRTTVELLLDVIFTDPLPFT